MKWLATGVLFVAIFGMGQMARAADLDEAAVSKFLASAKDGTRAVLGATYPEKQVQEVLFIAGDFYYMIDVRAQFCFIRGRAMETTPGRVPCKNLKKGYPLIAPIITWDD